MDLSEIWGKVPELFFFAIQLMYFKSNKDKEEQNCLEHSHGHQEVLHNWFDESQNFDVKFEEPVCYEN